MNVGRFAEGCVCWIDLGTPDIDVTQAFYRDLFGWSVAPPDPSGYRLAAIRGQLVAALGPAEDPGVPYWTINMMVADIRAATTRLADAGADILIGPTAAGPHGHYAVARDPVGTPISLWQPGAHLGMQRAHEPGTFAGVSLLTDQPERAVSFYRAAWGWHTDDSQAEFWLPDSSIAPIRPAPGASTSQKSLWLVRFASADIDADVTRARQLGATQVESDPSTSVTLRDPTGALFGLVQGGRTSAVG
jgi:predicted enzyme related to lactoylglutathione lyase